MFETGSSAFAQGRTAAVIAQFMMVCVVPALAQSADRTSPVIAWVANENANPERLAIFKKGLAELGYGEGENIRIEYRVARLDGEYAPIMRDLVALKVAIIITGITGTKKPGRSSSLSSSSVVLWTVFPQAK